MKQKKNLTVFLKGISVLSFLVVFLLNITTSSTATPTGQNDSYSLEMLKAEADGGEYGIYCAGVGQHGYCLSFDICYLGNGYDGFTWGCSFTGSMEDYCVGGGDFCG